MGKSQSISDFQKSDGAFNTYITEATKTLEARVSHYEDAFKNAVTQFYSTNNWDHQILGMGTHYDFQQRASFSMDDITKRLYAVANAIFGAAVPGSTSSDATTVPEGTVVTASKDAVEAIAPYEALATAAAVVFISDVMHAFDFSISASSDDTTSSRILAPGITLHAWSHNESFQQEDMFNNQEIITNCLNYQLIYSVKQTQMQDIMDTMNALYDEITHKNTALVQMNKHLDDMYTDPTQTQTTIDAYQKLIKHQTKNLNKLQGEVDATVAKYKAGTLPTSGTATSS